MFEGRYVQLKEQHPILREFKRFFEDETVMKVKQSEVLQSTVCVQRVYKCAVPCAVRPGGFNSFVLQSPRGNARCLPRLS